MEQVIWALPRSTGRLSTRQLIPPAVCITRNSSQDAEHAGESTTKHCPSIDTSDLLKQAGKLQVTPPFNVQLPRSSNDFCLEVVWKNMVKELHYAIESRAQTHQLSEKQRVIALIGVL